MFRNVQMRKSYPLCFTDWRDTDIFYIIHPFFLFLHLAFVLKRNVIYDLNVFQLQQGRLPLQECFLWLFCKACSRSFTFFPWHFSFLIISTALCLNRQVLQLIHKDKYICVPCNSLLLCKFCSSMCWRDIKLGLHWFAFCSVWRAEVVTELSHVA